MKKRKIYTVAASHLDTSWLWDLETTIKEYIPATLTRNFALFEKFPGYTFGFEGSYRYELMEEYYPELFEKLKEYVNKGRWVPVGSAYENGDVNTPSPEALFRNILYGNSYFEEKFKKPSNDIFLPDCFGFGYALPSIMAHAGLKGFSTGKLAWGGAYGTPFDLGKWYGVDGSYVYANIRPGSYSRSLSKVRKHKDIEPKLSENERFDLPMTAAFYGTGDRGGAPSTNSVRAVMREASQNNNSETEVLSVSSAQLFEAMDNELSQEQKAKLPSWNNELLLTNHGVGSYTSRTVGKRWNKNCERLSFLAEQSCAFADITGVYGYPSDILTRAWKRTIAHQFHDDITGTSFNECYKRNWNDYMLSQNEFAHEYAESSKSIIRRLNTSWVKGTAIIVHNPTQFTRREAVNTKIPGAVKCVRVTDDDDGELVSQVNRAKDGLTDITFIAVMKPFSYAVFDACEAMDSYAGGGCLLLGENTIENDNIRVTLSENGGIKEIYNKSLCRQVLSNEINFGLYDYKGSKSYPAWELVYDEVMKPAREHAHNTQITVVENGPARIVLEIKSRAGESRFVQKLSLDAFGEYVRSDCEVDWRSTASLLKLEFPLSVNNDKAVYDLGLGSIERTTNRPELYEVPAQLWADMSEPDGSFGVSVLSDSRQGWDKPNENTLRLTIVHTPYYPYRWECSQHLMDIGINRFSYGVFAHDGKAGASTQKTAECFNFPMPVFTSDCHSGRLGREISFMSVSDDCAVIRSIKKAEDGNGYIIRLSNCENKHINGVKIGLSADLTSAQDCLASEFKLGDIDVKNNEIVFDIGAFSPKTIRFITEQAEREPLKQQTLSLPYCKKIITAQNERTPFLTVPKELLKSSTVCGGVGYSIENAGGSAVACRGQKIAVPDGCKKISFLSCSVNGDKNAAFKAGTRDIKIKISDSFERIGKWDLIALEETAEIKEDTVAFCATHMHENGEDVVGKQFYMFKYSIDIDDETELVLPDDGDILIFAATALFENDSSLLTTELFDRIEKRPFDYVISQNDLLRTKPSAAEAKISKFLNRKKSFTVDALVLKGTFQVADVFSLLRNAFSK